MKATPEFYFDPETRVATCALIEQNGRGYVGMAMCHPEDEDMMSEKTGCEIALRRMEIEALRAYRRDELEPGLKALKQLYYSMKHSGQFNKKSYEAKMLFRQMNQKQEDIDFIKEVIAQRKEELKDFSIVTFKHRVGNKDLGTIGIIGPKRMDYSKVISVMKYISKKLNENKDNN